MLYLADPDRRVRDQLALRAGRDRLHADLRRLRRAQPVARQHHGHRRDHRLACRRDWARASAGGTVIGIAAGLAAAYVTYFVVVRPIQTSRAIPRDETEIFLLTGTLLWGIMIQVGLAYLFTDNPVTMRPLIGGVVNIAGVRTPTNEIMIAVDLLGRDRAAVAAGQPHARGQGAARRLDQSARADAARLRAVERLSARLEHLRRAGGHRRRAARLVPRRRIGQRRARSRRARSRSWCWAASAASPAR